MARIRTIKPRLWFDGAFCELSRDARLLFIGMISQADDDGRLVASAASLIGAIYPYDSVTAKQVERWRDEIVSAGMAEVYVVGKATYAYLPSFTKHQVINKRTPSILPSPEESVA